MTRLRVQVGLPLLVLAYAAALFAVALTGPEYLLVLLCAVIAATAALLALPHPRAVCYGYVGALLVVPHTEVAGVSIGLADAIGALACITLIGNRWPRAPVAFLFALPGAALLSIPVLIATFPEEAITSTLRAFRLVAAAATAVLFFATSPNAPALRHLLRLILLLGGLGGAAALAIFFAGIDPPWPGAEQYLYGAAEPRLRGQGLLGESSSLANQMLLIVVLALTAGSAVLPRVLRALVLMSASGAIIVTFSRTALLALGLAFLLYLFFFQRAARVQVAMLVAAIASAFAVVPTLRMGILFRLTQSFGDAEVTGVELTSGRLANWQRLLTEGLDPWYLLLGHGYKSIVARNDGAGPEVYGDNVFVTTLYETGLLGVLLTGTVLIRIYRDLRAPAEGLRELLRAGLMLWLLVELFSGLTGDVLTFSRTVGVWFVLHAAFVATGTKDELGLQSRGPR